MSQVALEAMRTPGERQENVIRDAIGTAADIGMAEQAVAKIMIVIEFQIRRKIV